MSTAIHAMVERARAGSHAGVIARLGSGWAVFGERQFLRGYALLLPDPVVPDLQALGPGAADRFLGDLHRLGSALRDATGALRINYAIFGNLEPALHAHLVPRYAEEPAHLRAAHPWAYDWSAGAPFDPAAFSELRIAVRARLGTLIVEGG